MVWERARCGRPSRRSSAGPPHRGRVRGAARRRPRAAVRERTGLELDATFPATTPLGARPSRRRPRGRASWPTATSRSWLLLPAHRRARHRRRQRGAHAALPPRRHRLGRRAARAVRHPARAAAADRRLRRAWSDGGIPVPRGAGDQQASLFGLRCWAPGEAKVTLGTGASCSSTPARPPAPPDGVLASTRLAAGRHDAYALEGFVPDRRRRARLVRPHRRAAARPGARRRCAAPATTASSASPRSRAPASPTWNPAATGALLGLRPRHTRADLARAVVDGILHQVVDGLEAIGRGRPDGRRRARALGLGRSSGSPTSPACGWSGPPVRTRRRWEPPCSPASPPACGRRRRPSRRTR